jgi:hypothetical protein
MKVLFVIWTLLWKTAVLAIAGVLGALGASGVGWHGAEIIAKLPFIKILAEFVGLSFGDEDVIGSVVSAEFSAAVKFSISAAMCLGPSFLVYKIAKPVLFIMVPILLWVTIVGARNGMSTVLTSAERSRVKEGKESRIS